LGAAAGAAAGELGAAGVACWAGAAGLGATDWRCMPKDLPPPRRAASALPMLSPSAMNTAKAATIDFFICISINLKQGRKTKCSLEVLNFRLTLMKFKANETT
jgi:hypothetical protein